MSEYEFVAEVWRWNGEAAWHLVTLPHEVTDDIDERHEGSRAGFGSRRVEVTVDSTPPGRGVTTIAGTTLRTT